MWRWGSDWLWEVDEPPLELYDRQTGRPVRPQLVDENTGSKMFESDDIVRSLNETY